MSYRANIVYRYDGTFPGFLCCVFESFRAKEVPAAIEYADEVQTTLLPVKEIATDSALARRVERSIPEKISPEAYEWVRDGFLICLPQRELLLLRFLLLGYRVGDRLTKLSVNDDVNTLEKAVRQMRHEAHLFTGFLRFSDYGEFLAGVITPKNNVLPVIAPHFCGRYSGENFVIYDKTHQIGFLYRSTGERRFFQADSLTLPELGEDEREYRALWKKFYDAVAVEGRSNPRQRMTMMPKRYWGDMTEFCEEK